MLEAGGWVGLHDVKIKPSSSSSLSLSSPSSPLSWRISGRARKQGRCGTERRGEDADFFGDGVRRKGREGNVRDVEGGLRRLWGMRVSDARDDEERVYIH